MQLFPAIDVLDGRCVRLYKGDYSKSTDYGHDPAQQATEFAEVGCDALHVVDLDAARSGHQTNLTAIEAICSRLRKIGWREGHNVIQVGGGVRTLEAAQRLVSLGVDRVVVGTAALERPQLVSELAEHGIRVVVGIDARGNRVATHGWTADDGVDPSTLAGRFSSEHVDAFVVTQINRDGTLEGPDTKLLSEVRDCTDVPIIASGGVGSLDHLRTLKRLAAEMPEVAIGGGPNEHSSEQHSSEQHSPGEHSPEHSETNTAKHIEKSGSLGRIAGVIVGKALYDGAFSLAEALEV